MAAAQTLTLASSYHQRLWAYLQERFPLLKHGILIISYCSSNQFLAHALENPGAPMCYTLHSLYAAVTVLCVFFHLRVFDEHKDYADDCRHYPQRILSRGLITLGQLKILGGVAILVEFTMGALAGPGAFIAVAAVVVFSLLMLKEFFIGGWLRKRLMLYAITHMCIMPLISLAVFSIVTGLFPWQAPAWFWLYGFVGFFVSFNWEISRKIRAPEDELDGVDSYSKIFGTYGAAYAVILIRVIDTAMVSMVGMHLGLSIWFYAVLIVLFLVCFRGLLQFRFHTNALTAKRMETYAGMYIIAFDLTLAVEIVRMQGIVL